MRVGRKQAMAQIGHDSHRDRRVDPAPELRHRVFARVAGARAYTVRTRTRVVGAAVGVLAFAALITTMASQAVYHRYAVGLAVESAQSTRLIATLLLLTGTTVIATWVAV